MLTDILRIALAALIGVCLGAAWFFAVDAWQTLRRLHDWWQHRQANKARWRKADAEKRRLFKG